jgi:hypothetical protein
MSTRLRELIDCLHGQSIQPTGEELADVLWLALRMGDLEATQATRQPVDVDREAGPVAPTPLSTRQTPPPSQPETSVATAVPGEEKRVPLYVESSSAAAPDTEGELVTGA